MNVKEPLHRCNLHIVISCHGSMEIMSRVKKKHIMLVGLKVFFFLQQRENSTSTSIETTAKTIQTPHGS